jgi:hypothetical protein
MGERRLNLALGISFGLHALVILALLLEMVPRRLPEPVETGISVELVSPTELARGERLAPTPDPVTAPPTPTLNPTSPEPPRSAPPQPPPPPPPPPPAQAPASVPPAPQRPSPATPPAEAAPSPMPLPPPPPPIPTPPRPTPPLPLPPPPTPPPPEPAQQPGTGRTPPVQRPEERSQSVLNTLERLRQQQRQQEPPTGRPNPAQASPSQGGGVPQGTANLTAAERAGLAERISECWSVDAGAPGLNQIVVELRIEVDTGGTVRVVRPNGGIPADPRARMVFESARRALLDPRCNPLPLPRDRLDALRNAIFRFRPADLGLR